MRNHDIEELIREDLVEKLDPQKGRAKQHFTHQVIDPMDRHLVRAQTASLRPKNLVLIGVAMLVCVVAGMYLSRFMPAAKPVAEVKPPVEIAPVEIVAIPSDYEHAHLQHMIDAGPVRTSDNAPARIIRQEQLDRYNWVDPQTGGTFTYLLPSTNEYVIEAHRQ